MKMSSVAQGFAASMLRGEFPPHNWQRKCTKSEVRKVYDSYVSWYCSLVKTGGSRPNRIPAKGLTKKQLQKIYDTRGFGSDEYERMKVREHADKKIHSRRFYELMEEIETYRRMKSKNNWKGVYVWERETLRDQENARNHKEPTVGLQYCCTINDVFSLANDRTVHKRIRREAVRFLRENAIKSIESVLVKETYASGIAFPIPFIRYHYIGPDWKTWLSKHVRRGDKLFRVKDYRDWRSQIIEEACLTHNYFDARSKYNREFDSHSYYRYYPEYRERGYSIEDIHRCCENRFLHQYLELDIEVFLELAKKMEQDRHTLMNHEVIRSAKESSQTSNTSHRQLRALGFVA